MAMMMIRNMTKYNVGQRFVMLRWVYFLLAFSSHVIFSVMYRDQLRAVTTTTTNIPSEVHPAIPPTIQQSHDVSWLLQGNVTSKTSLDNITCGSEKKGHPVIDYFGDSLMNLTNDCRELAIFSAAFDNWTLQQFHIIMLTRRNHSEQLLESHGRCFFLFTSSDVATQVKQLDVVGPVSLIGHFWVIPIPLHLLPFAKNRQNMHFIKYLGHALFQETARTLIWQDATTFFSLQNMYRVPSNYQDLTPTDPEAAACLTTIHWPTKFNYHDGNSTIYQDICSSQDSDVERRQCQLYLRNMTHPRQMDQVMVSTDFLIWKNTHKDCQIFNAELQCTMLGELRHTTIDDTLVLPYAIHQLDLQRFHKGIRIRNNAANFDQRINDLELYPKEYQDHVGPVVRILRSNCHWNRGPLGQNCFYWQDVKQSSIPAIPFDDPSNQSVDFQTCTSPESHIAFPLQGDTVSTFDNTHSCGLTAANAISVYLREVVRDRMIPSLLEEECHNMVVFGVALGQPFVQQLQTAMATDTMMNRSQHFMEQHGKCFFLFVSQDDMPEQQQQRGSHQPLLYGHFWFIPIPPWIFPYHNARRNAKLLKYMGHLVFPNVRTVLWQDAKLVSDFQTRQPIDYHRVISHHDTCLTTFGLPVHGNTMGAYHPAVLRIGDARRRRRLPHDKFQAHCNTIVRAIQRRPNVTDSIDSVAQQCMAYVQHHNSDEKDHSNDTSASSLDALNQGMVDNALMIWNHESEQCRDFGNQFRCTLLDQIHCHSDRDQIPFPFVVNEIGLEGYYRPKQEQQQLLVVDDNWNPQWHDLDMKWKRNSSASSNSTMIRILRANCHWYSNRIGGGCSYWQSGPRVSIGIDS